MEPTFKCIQIYGERCSGTNYLQLLLEQNLESVRICYRFEWKHFFHREGIEKADDYLFIIIYRNPFDWLRSMHKKPHHAAPELRRIDFSDFIRKEWWSVWDEHARKAPGDELYGTEMMFERCPETGRRFANVIRLRTAKIRDWESLKDKTKNNIYVRYEDLAANPQAFINTLSERFGLKKTQVFTNIEGFKGRRKKFRPKKYKPIKAEDWRYIVHELDAQLEKSIGYDVDVLALEAERATFEAERARFEAERATLEAEIVALTETADRLAAEKAGLEAEKAGLEAEREHLSQSFHRLEHEYVTAQSQRDYLQQEREVLYRSRLLRTLVRLRALRRIGPRGVLKKLLAKMQPASSLRLVIDYPLANSTVLVSKRVYVAGWTFSGGGPVDRVEVFVGETLLGCLACGVERPDVAAAFPEAVHAGGYGGVVALKGVPSGAHELVVRATDRAGKSESVRRFIVVGASSEGASGAPTTVLPEVRATASSRSR